MAVGVPNYVLLRLQYLLDGDPWQDSGPPSKDEAAAIKLWDLHFAPNCGKKTIVHAIAWVRDISEEAARRVYAEWLSDGKDSSTTLGYRLAFPHFVCWKATDVKFLADIRKHPEAA